MAPECIIKNIMDSRIIIVTFFLFGLIIGSFLNVVLFRYNTGRGIGGRSKCFSCKRSLGPVDLVPVFSFLMFRGKCRTCSTKISWQYPAVELLTGLLFAVAAAQGVLGFEYNILQFTAHMTYVLALLSMLVLITVYDIKHKIIPDTFVLIFSVLCFLNLFFAFGSHDSIHFVLPSLFQVISGFLLAFPFYLFWLISSGRWMGLGDAKLVIGFGWLLGLGAGATAIIYGFWIGAAVSLLMMFFGFIVRNFGLFTEGRYKVLTSLSMKTEIPFAPFLITGLLMVLFFGYNMFSVFHI